MQAAGLLEIVRDASVGAPTTLHATTLHATTRNAMTTRANFCVRDSNIRPRGWPSGAALRRAVASACIDVSDGLAGDLGKLAAASGCGARIDALIDYGRRLRCRRCAPNACANRTLAGGDDYETRFHGVRCESITLRAGRAGIRVAADR
jgi:thiamine monophosphate kinase